MSAVQEFFIHASRLCRSRGFGVQSPADYIFITDVINARYPYYAYEDLHERFPHTDRRREKLYRLCFRIANNVQPHTIVCLLDDPACAAYLRAGCHRAVITPHISGDAATQHLVCVAQLSDKTAAMTDGLIARGNDACSVTVLDGIHAGKTATRLWDAIVRSGRATTFDLYHAGIVLADKKRRYKHNYSINF